MSIATFTPRNAIVTGAAMGIGHSVALRLAADGMNVLVNDLPTNQQLLDDVVKELQSKGVKAVSYAGSAADETDVRAMVAMAVEAFGSLDVMVCNAGIASIKPLLETTWEDFQNILDINLKSAYHGYKIAAEQMIRQGNGGRIIGAASTVAKKGYPFMSAYSASKFAIRGLTQSTAQEVGLHGITVNAYCPGVIWTPLVQRLGNNLSAAIGENGADLHETWEKACALRRVGNGDDVAGLVSWLASKDSQFVTGQSLIVDGGSLFD